MSELAIKQEYSVATNDLILNNQSFAQVMLVADMMAKGVATVPKHLQNRPSDCAAIVMQSLQWRMNPYAVAQKTHLVNGVLGYEAQLVNAVITSLAPTKDRLHFEWFGKWEQVIGKVKEVTSKKHTDDAGNPKKYMVPDWGITDEAGLGVKVWATMQNETTPRELTLLLSQARTRNSTLWADDPRQQLAYLAIKRWSRLYCPDVIMGVYSVDELEPEIEINPTTPVTPIRPTVVQPTSAKPAAPVADAEYEVVTETRAQEAPGQVAESAPAATESEPAQASLIPETDADGSEEKVYISPAMLKIATAKLTNLGVNERDLLDQLNIESLDKMESRHFNGAMKWVTEESARKAAK